MKSKEKLMFLKVFSLVLTSTLSVLGIFVCPVLADVHVESMTRCKKLTPIGVMWCIKASGTTTEADGTEVYLVGPDWQPWEPEHDTGTQVKDGKFRFAMCGCSDWSYGKFKVKIGHNESPWIEPTELAKCVGGVWVSVDKFGLLAPYVGLTSAITVATVAAAIYVKRVKREKER